jgi:hypothetical protein
VSCQKRLNHIVGYAGQEIHVKVRSYQLDPRFSACRRTPLSPLTGNSPERKADVQTLARGDADGDGSQKSAKCSLIAAPQLHRVYPGALHRVLSQNPPKLATEVGMSSTVPATMPASSGQWPPLAFMRLLRVAARFPPPLRTCPRRRESRMAPSSRQGASTSTGWPDSGQWPRARGFRPVVPLSPRMVHR